MKKYTIEVTEEQMRLIADCLEDVSRFASGQPELRWTIENMLKGLPHEEWMRRRELVNANLHVAKMILFPDLHEKQGLSYNSTEFIGNTYQIYRTMLYAINRSDEVINVYSSPALPSGTMGTIKIEEVKK